MSVGLIRPDWYEAEVARVRRFLQGEDGDDILTKLEEAMRAASIAMDYEQAALFRDHRDLVALLLEKQRCIATPVLEHNAVVVDGSIRDGHCRLLFVRHGRLVDTMKCVLGHEGGSIDISERDAVQAKIKQYFRDPESNRPERYFKAEIEDIRLLAHWLYVNREASMKLDWNDGDQVEEWCTALLGLEINAFSAAG